MNYDIYLVGVGGQGILTIGEIIADAAHRQQLPAQFYPTEGMAQRGGFVKAQIRIGRPAGPNIPEKSADLVISMELSEALKAVRYVRPGGDFLLWTHVWAPTAVLLGKASYPSPEQIENEIKSAGARLHILKESLLPALEGKPFPSNIFILGAALGCTRLREVVQPADIVQVIRHRWPRQGELNAAAFQAGLDHAPVAG